MSSVKPRHKKPREIKYFKKYPKPSNDANATILDNGKVFFKGKDVTPLPQYDPAYLMYPIADTSMLKKVNAPPLPPPTPIEDVDPSVWLNYNLDQESSNMVYFIVNQSSQLEESGYEPLRTDITLEELTREEKEAESPLKEEKKEGMQVKILDDELYAKAEYKKIGEGKFVLVLDETETIFLLEISTPHLEASSKNEEIAYPTHVLKGKKKKDKKEARKKATSEHETQTIPPLMIDEEVETDNPPQKDFSNIVTDSEIYDGQMDAAQQRAKCAEKEIKCLYNKLYDMLMNPYGHFKNDLSYINFYLQVMAAELKKLKHDEQIKIICRFIKDYEEDKDIDQLAKELDNDYDGFIKEVRKVRDKMYPPKEEEEDAPEIGPAIQVQNIEITPLPGYKPRISHNEVREILELDEFAHCSLYKDPSPEEEFQRLSQSDAFTSALNKVENILTYQKEYDLIYNSLMTECIPEQPDLESMYNLDLQWEFQDEAAKGKAVNCISWCRECPDILAAGYGGRGYVNSLIPPERGLLLIWSSALPKEKPLSRLETKSSVISICFHPESFYNLALGLSSGDVVLVEVNKEISSISSNVVLQENHSFGHAYALAWFICEPDEPNYEDEPEETNLIAGGREGALFTWKSSFGLLISESVLNLPKICGRVKGIPENLPSTKTPMSVPSRPAVTCIELHPKCKGCDEEDDEKDIIENSEKDEVSAMLGYDLSHLYLAGTDDGTVHQCYFRKIHYHQDFFRAHNGPVYCISFNPFVDTVFLTCGGDWAIRIWCLGVGEPLITLKHDMEHVETAHWSVHYPTIVISIKGNELCIWDLARRTSSPVSSFANPKKHDFTSVNFSVDGLNVVIGDAEGDVYIYHLKDVPFMSKFPVQHLVNAIKKALVNKPEVLLELEDTGDPFTAN